MNACLINTFPRVWIRFELMNDHVSRIYFVNRENQEVAVPAYLSIFNDIDRQKVTVTDNLKYYYVSNTGNYTIFLGDEHVLDFSHKSFWKVTY